MMKLLPNYDGLTVYAICGFKSSGKSSVANMLGELKNANVMSFAKPVYDIVDTLFNLPELETKLSSYVFYTDKEKPLNDSTGSYFFPKDFSLRDALNKIGQGMKTIMWDSLWDDILLDNLDYMYISSGKKCTLIIPDVRYFTNIKLIEDLEKHGARVVRIWVKRKSATPKWYNELDEKKLSTFFQYKREYGFSSGESDWCYSIGTNKYSIDYEINNDGTIKELEEQVLKIS